MANTVSYSASMRTRKTNSASNAKSSAASQEYYENTYNYVGIVHFAGMALSGKVITGISLRVVAAQAGYGTGHTKTVYVRKSNYQSASQSGITGLGYCGDALGTFTGAFYGNTSTYTLSGDLLNNLAAYIAEGNNTICLYNPNPVKSSQGYSTNYLQWSECTITVTYEEAASKPSLSKTSFEMGTAVTIYTNRQSSIATHTIRYSFFSSTGTIATGVTTSCTWTPPVSLAAQIPNATSGWGTILCDTYVNGSLVSTNTCAFQLTVPASVVPSISSVSFAEATAGIADRFGGYVRTRSKLSVGVTAAGTQGSSISAYRTSIDGVTYSGASFTTNTLNAAGNLTMTVTVTDGWYEGAPFRQGERIVCGRQEHAGLHGVLQAVQRRIMGFCRNAHAQRLRHCRDEPAALSDLRSAQQLRHQDSRTGRVLLHRADGVHRHKAGHDGLLSGRLRHRLRQGRRKRGQGGIWLAAAAFRATGRGSGRHGR